MVIIAVTPTLLAHDFARVFVMSEADELAVAQMMLAGPLDEFELANEH